MKTFNHRARLRPARPKLVRQGDLLRLPQFSPKAMVTGWHDRASLELHLPAARAPCRSYTRRDQSIPWASLGPPNGSRTSRTAIPGDTAPRRVYTTGFQLQNLLHLHPPGGKGRSAPSFVSGGRSRLVSCSAVP